MSFHKRWLHLFAIVFIVLAAFGGRQPAVHAAGTYTVNTTLDLAGPTPTSGCFTATGAPSLCSLRQAINEANNDPGSTIEFNIPLTDPGYHEQQFPTDPTNTFATWTITPTIELNAVEANGTKIDATTQTARKGDLNPKGPEVIIDGSLVTTSGGISLDSSDNQVLGLGITNFRGTNLKGVGIEIFGNNNIIQGNYVGTDPTGTVPAGNNDAGIIIYGNNNTIGGNSPIFTTQYNVISGNTRDGVLVIGNAAQGGLGSGNLIRGNYIGTDPQGNNAVPNGGSGVHIRTRASGNVVGGEPDATDATFRNYISGNSEYGVLIDGGSTNAVYGNYIGLNQKGTAKIPNTLGGVQIISSGREAAGNTVGAIAEYARNYIAGNNNFGINITGAQASGNSVLNNYIGLGSKDAVPSGAGINQNVGVLIDKGGNNNIIGGAGAARNIISGNDSDGVRIVGSSTTGQIAFSNNNRVLGNYIGTDPTGLLPIPNLGAGVVVGTNANFTTIGGTVEEERNLIAYNSLNGIHVRPNVLSDPRVLTTTLNLNTVAFNTGVGVLFDTTDYNAINGTDVLTNTDIGLELMRTRYSTMQNGVVWGNGGNGIQIESAEDSTMQPHDVRNNVVGVSVTDSYITTIEGTGANARAFITSNASHGIQVSNSITTTIQYVDTNPVHEDESPNVGDGVNAVGGPLRGLYVSNSKIDKNGGVGVNVSDAEFVRVEGTEAQRTTVNNNALEGVIFNNVISGTVQYQDLWNNQHDGLRVQGNSEDVSVYRNILRFNGPQNAEGATFETACSLDPAVQRGSEGQGVSVRDTAKHVRIIRSLFGQNCGLGILREPNGPEPTTPNEGIQPPIITALNQNGELKGKLQADCAKDKCAGWIVELFKSDLVSESNPKGEPDGEGNTKVNVPEDQIRTFDAKGNFNFALDLGSLRSLPRQLLGTATDTNGNTSEFGVFQATRGVIIEPPRTTLNAIPTQVITYSHTVTNTGTVDEPFRLSYFSEQGFGSDRVKLQPSGQFNVPAGTSVPVTVTLILPQGTDPRVRAGITEHTYITVTAVAGPRQGTNEVVSDVVTDTTVFTKSAAITVTPLTAVGQTKVGKPFDYAHQITNNGNITATIVLSFDPDPIKRPLWPTTVSVAGTPSVAPITSVTGGTVTISLAPGQSRTMTVSVTPPNGTAAGAKDTAIVYVNVPEYPSQSKVVSDTTTVLVDTKASIIPDREGNGVAGKISIYQHTVQNLSNGSVKLKLVAEPSNLGSTVTFESTTPGVALDNQNVFTLGTSTGTNLLNFNARVSIATSAPLGSVDVITIKLVDATTGEVLGTVQDRTIIGRSRVFLPIVIKSP